MIFVYKYNMEDINIWKLVLLHSVIGRFRGSTMCAKENRDEVGVQNR